MPAVLLIWCRSALVGFTYQSSQYGAELGFHLSGCQYGAELERVLRLDLDPATAMLGINNRNLETFTVDIANNARIMDSAPGQQARGAQTALHTCTRPLLYIAACAWWCLRRSRLALGPPVSVLHQEQLQV